MIIVIMPTVSNTQKNGSADLDPNQNFYGCGKLATRKYMKTVYF
jgi:hypothetical protein